ncbi:ABC transporter, partial [Streptomyces kronopolitis]
GADIIEIGEHGVRRVAWDELALVDHWRRYLGDPRSYLRHVLD